MGQVWHLLGDHRSHSGKAQQTLPWKTYTMTAQRFRKLCCVPLSCRETVGRQEGCLPVGAGEGKRLAGGAGMFLSPRAGPRVLGGSFVLAKPELGDPKSSSPFLRACGSLSDSFSKWPLKLCLSCLGVEPCLARGIYMGVAPT